ncbi:guanylate kinase [Arachidicoccus rhizosphaerae]|jgi:guanylate kinase|uniref:Guanylate kinase n=1 Tax=Arachidicoccus rhizosphaerae TaxID=551991 RepID=A0A1H3YH69_9BACT|nr:guanylate kinase [Arachidicoccus rhizosphaerae]SEA10897.1 guanylate kinase [Arachidicoccus rhizosphaerae]
MATSEQIGKHHGKMIILTAPSGAGKSSIAHYLLDKHADKLSFSVSATTRNARGAEKDGVDYYFLSVDQFKANIQNDAFLEWEMVYEGKYYGTLKSELNRIWDSGKLPIMDIDVKGAIHVRKQFGEECLSIFIQPPSVEALEERLKGRGTETPESIQTRLNKAKYELSFQPHFDKTVINENLDDARRQAEQLIMDFIR